MESFIDKALYIALQAHRGQVDKGGHPYILHPLHVMHEMDDMNDMIVALLHDVVEDSFYTLRDIELSLGLQSDDPIIIALSKLTKEKGESYEKYIERIASHPISLRVKLIDLQHNLRMDRLTKSTEQIDYARIQKYMKALQYLQNFYINNFE